MWIDKKVGCPGVRMKENTVQCTIELAAPGDVLSNFIFGHPLAIAH